MPQLMPLMWVFSVFMSMLIFLMYMELYYYIDSNIIMEDSNCNKSLLLFKW